MKDKLKSKIKLPQIDPEDFPYKFYMCYWKDIQSDSSWHSLTTLKKSQPATCITMGWLLSTHKGNYTFCADVNFNDDGTINEGGNSTVIPKTNVLKLKEIKI